MIVFSVRSTLGWYFAKNIVGADLNQRGTDFAGCFCEVLHCGVVYVAAPFRVIFRQINRRIEVQLLDLLVS